MTPHEWLEIRANKFWTDFGKMQTETLEFLKKTRGNKSVSRTIAFKWHRQDDE